jgi:hypothetical protein
MAPRKLPTRGGAKATEAKEATGTGGTGASGAAAGASGAATVRTRAMVHRMPGKSLISSPFQFCMVMIFLLFFFSLGFLPFLIQRCLHPLNDSLSLHATS